MSEHVQEQLTIWAEHHGGVRRVSIRSAPWRLSEAINAALDWRSYQRRGTVSELWITRYDGDIGAEEVWRAEAAP